MSSLGGLDEAKKLFDKNVTSIKNLVEKIGDLSKLTLEQKNYFLYDDSNIINYTFYTELNQKVQTYGLISTAALGIRSKLKTKSTKKHCHSTRKNNKGRIYKNKRR